MDRIYRSSRSVCLAPCPSLTPTLNIPSSSDPRENHSHPWTSSHIHSWPHRTPKLHAWKRSLTLLGYSGELHSHFPAPGSSTSWKTKKQEQTQKVCFIGRPQDDTNQSWRDQRGCQNHVCCRFLIRANWRDRLQKRI